MIKSIVCAMIGLVCMVLVQVSEAHAGDVTGGEERDSAPSPDNQSYHTSQTPPGVPEGQSIACGVCGVCNFTRNIIINSIYYSATRRDSFILDELNPDNVVYFASAFDFAKAISNSDAYSPTGRWVFECRFTNTCAKRDKVHSHACGQFIYQIHLEYMLEAIAPSSAAISGSTTTGVSVSATQGGQSQGSVQGNAGANGSGNPTAGATGMLSGGGSWSATASFSSSATSSITTGVQFGWFLDGSPQPIMMGCTCGNPRLGVAPPRMKNNPGGDSQKKAGAALPLPVESGGMVAVCPGTLCDFGLINERDGNLVAVFVETTDGSLKRIDPDENGVCTVAKVAPDTDTGVKFYHVATGAVLAAVPFLFTGGGGNHDPSAPVISDMKPESFNITRIDPVTGDNPVTVTIHGENLADSSLEIRNTDTNMVTHAETLAWSDRGVIAVAPSEAFAEPGIKDVVVTTPTGSDTASIESYYMNIWTDRMEYRSGETIMVNLVYSASPETMNSRTIGGTFIKVSCDLKARLVCPGTGQVQPDGSILIPVTTAEMQETLIFEATAVGGYPFFASRIAN
jgi:hypothetical protein